jgi:predicted Zn finger-like uncharacterized protein
MLVNCNSCQKKFVVPEGAITSTGRLVQCGSCGNKWTQYLNQEVVTKKENNLKKISPNKSQIFSTKRKTKKKIYTTEYLQKKHGLIINETNSLADNILLQNKKKKNTFGFYNYVITLLVFVALLLGLLDLTKEIIIFKYPSAELYINYFYEVVDIIKISLNEFISQFNN